METELKFDWTPDERTNLVRELLLCANLGMYTDVLSLWDIASTQFWVAGYWDDYFRCGSIALRSAEMVRDAKAQAEVLSDLGYASMERAEYSLSQTRLKRSLSLFESINDKLGQARVLGYLGILSHRRDRLGSAIRYYRRALGLARSSLVTGSDEERAKWIHRESELHNLLGNLYLKLRDFGVSQRELELSLALQRSLGDDDPSRYYWAAPLLNLGRVHFLQKKYDRAIQYYEECRKLSEELGRPDMIGGALFRLAEVAEAQGDKEKALELAREAEQVSGTDMSSLRERATSFRFRLSGKSNVGSRTLRRMTNVLFMFIDLLGASPVLAFHMIKYYISVRALADVKRSL